MRDRTKSTVRWASTAVAILWMLIVGWDQFNDLGIFSLEPSEEDVREQLLQKQLKECKGTFQERYDCKSALLRAAGRDSFNFWARKYTLTFGPALFVYVGFHFWLRSVETTEEKARRVRRMARIEARRQKESRFAKEQGRRRSLTAQRRQDVRKGEQDAAREERPRPLNVMVISQDDDWVESFRKPLWDAGYLVIPTDLRDVFLAYREIGYHIVLTEVQFEPPADLHPDDAEDEEFPGRPLPLPETIQKARERKDNVRIVACAPEFANLDAQAFIKAATTLGVDAVIEKPFDPEKAIDLFNKLMDTRLKKENEDEEADA